MNDKNVDETTAAQVFKGDGPVAPSGAAAVGNFIGAQRVDVPRSLSKIRQELVALAAMAGENWYYRYPVKNKDGGTEWIEGPSIKLTNDLARSYGNCVVDVRAFDAGHDAWMFYARFVDIETGFAMTRAFQQDKGQTSVKTKNPARQRDIAFQIGQSKAIRNVIVNALQTHADFCFEEAKKNLVETVGKNLAGHRQRVLDKLAEMKVDPKRVALMIGRTPDKWLAPDVARVIAEIRAVNDGMAEAEELWPADTDRPTRADAATKPADETEQTSAQDQGSDPQQEQQPEPESPPPPPPPPPPAAEPSPPAREPAPPAAKAAPEPPPPQEPKKVTRPATPEGMDKPTSEQWWEWALFVLDEAKGGRITADYRTQRAGPLANLRAAWPALFEIVDNVIPRASVPDQPAPKEATPNKPPADAPKKHDPNKAPKSPLMMKGKAREEAWPGYCDWLVGCLEDMPPNMRQPFLASHGQEWKEISNLRPADVDRVMAALDAPE